MKVIRFSGIKKIRVALGDPSEPRNMRAIATISWRFFIVVAILSTFLSLSYGFLKFRETLHTLEQANAPVAASKSKFNQAEFNAMVAAWSARGLRYQVTEAAPPVVPDPSI